MNIKFDAQGRLVGSTDGTYFAVHGDNNTLVINAVFDVSDYIFEKSYYILVCIILYDKPPFYRL